MLLDYDHIQHINELMIWLLYELALVESREEGLQLMTLMIWMMLVLMTSKVQVVMVGLPMNVVY
jgi:hypothetical protein